MKFIYIISVFTLFMVFCNRAFSDDSASKRSGYIPNQIYSIEQDVFIIEDEIFGEFLVPPMNSESLKEGEKRIFSAPESIEQYNLNPQGPFRYKGKVIEVSNIKGIVKKGTLVRLTKISNSGSYRFTDSDNIKLSYFARIVDGDFAGTEANLHDISHTYSADNLKFSKLRPNQNILKHRFDYVFEYADY